MGGVNLAEESQRIMSSSGELLQVETKRKAQGPLEEAKLLNLPVLTRRIKVKERTHPEGGGVIYWVIWGPPIFFGQKRSFHKFFGF